MLELTQLVNGWADPRHLLHLPWLQVPREKQPRGSETAGGEALELQQAWILILPLPFAHGNAGQFTPPHRTHEVGKIVPILQMKKHFCQ